MKSPKPLRSMLTEARSVLNFFLVKDRFNLRLTKGNQYPLRTRRSFTRGELGLVDCEFQSNSQIYSSWSCWMILTGHIQKCTNIFEIYRDAEMTPGHAFSFNPMDSGTGDVKLKASVELKQSMTSLKHQRGRNSSTEHCSNSDDARDREHGQTADPMAGSTASSESGAEYHYASTDDSGGIGDWRSRC